MGQWGTCPLDFQQFHFFSLWCKSENQLSKYCVACEISWCRCQQLTALSICTALVTKLLVIDKSAAPALKPAVSAPLHKLQFCPFSQQIRATPLFMAVSSSGLKV